MSKAAKGKTQSAAAQKRRLIGFDAETWAALDLLSKESMKSVQELADEAFADLLKKHGRPTYLKEALRESARLMPANDREPVRQRPRRRTPD